MEVWELKLYVDLSAGELKIIIILMITKQLSWCDVACTLLAILSVLSNSSMHAASALFFVDHGALGICK